MMDKLKKIWQKLDGYKTILSAVGTPIASTLLYLTPDHTSANKLSMGFLLLFGGLGVTGLSHKVIKKLPSGLRK